MALPQALQQQIEQAEALQADLYPVESVPVEVTPAEPAAPEPAAPVEPPSNVVELPRTAEPAPPVEAPKPEASEDAAYWKQRFSTLQGKFNAEVPLLYQQLKEQGAQLTQLVAKLDEKASPVPPTDELVNSSDNEDFGETYVSMTDRRAEAVARRVFAQEIAKLREEFGVVQEQVGQVSQHVAMSAEEKFWTEVMNLVPDWKLVDADPSWVSFLDTTPEFAEDTYRVLASKAIQRGDATKIANLVKLWRGPQQAPTPQPSLQTELQRQVAPSTSRASAPAQPAGKIWTSAEYTEAMDVRNTQRLGPKEAARLEAEANKAVAEGRVRW